MTCKACDDAEKDLLSAEFSVGCRSCEARALAVTRADLLPNDQYVDAVRKLFGDGAKEGHRLVKAWVAKLRRSAAAAASGAAR